MFLGHVITSYREVAGDDNYEAVTDTLSELTGVDDRGLLFLEMCSLRCKHCHYVFNAKTKTHHSLLEVPDDSN